jgi:hypothetical protein
MRKATLLTVGGIAAAFTIGTVGSATASGLIHAHDLADGAANHRVIKNGSVHQSDMTDNVRRLLNKDNDTNTTLKGAIYRVENYKNGGGGSATVACADDDATSQKYTAIAGGVQGSTVAHQAADSFAVTSSFPGRMNWDTGEPKANRLDGWIVLGNSQYTGTLKVWALCVPNITVPVTQVDLDN